MDEEMDGVPALQSKAVEQRVWAGASRVARRQGSRQAGKQAGMKASWEGRARDAQGWWHAAWKEAGTGGSGPTQGADEPP
jgi:hypothetical protein